MCLKIIIFTSPGKTYIVYAWSLGLPNLVTTLPTGGDMFNVEKIAIQTSQFMYLWDIGGEMAHRRRSYFPGSQGTDEIFMKYLLCKTAFLKDI